eukprot:13884660-Ditylum_brightwellii.AAC.1
MEARTETKIEARTEARAEAKIVVKTEVRNDQGIPARIEPVAEVEASKEKRNLTASKNGRGRWNKNWPRNVYRVVVITTTTKTTVG